MSAEDVRIVREAGAKLAEIAEIRYRVSRGRVEDDAFPQPWQQAAYDHNAALARLEARLARLEQIEEAARRFVTRYRMPGAPPSWGDELAALESTLAATEEGAE